MPSFDTPEPVAVTVDMAAGSVRVVASDRTDTVVDVRPHNETRDEDVRAAEETRVDHAAGRLTVKGPKSWMRSLLPGVGPVIDVSIELPEGSSLDVTSWASLLCEGRLGKVDVRSSLGDIRVQSAAELRAKTSMGDVTVGRVDGRCDVDTSAGTVRVGEVDGPAVVKTSMGELSIGEVTGELRLATSHGDITVERALSSVVAKTSAGNVRVDHVVRGRVQLDTSYGDLTVGVNEGTAAWLDMSSRTGRVHSELEASSAPREGDETVEIRGRTQFGDILVRRA
ncbi:MAG TPA: DUF4097 family beta strand repeat-containing protein [Streptosporangiales bacterium]